MTGVGSPFAGIHPENVRRLEEYERGARRFRSAEMVRLIKVVTGEGLGTEGSVFREVTRYIDPETGSVIAVLDPIPGGDARHESPT